MVMAALMVGALDHPEVQDQVKSKFPQNFSRVARTLQQDPSCQLLIVLRKYLIQEEMHRFEPTLKESADEMSGPPDTETLEKGIIALTREWKSKLYNAMLESSVKSSSKGGNYNKYSKKLLSIQELTYPTRLHGIFF